MTDRWQAHREWDYRYYIDVQTRWLDNDQYGHLNNSAYYLIADSINNTYLADHCGLVAYPEDATRDASKSSSEGKNAITDAIGLVIGSSSQFFAPTSFPNTLRVGLRVVHLGSSSVTYEFGFFQLPAHEKGSSSLSSDSNAFQRTLPTDAKAAVITRVTHVFVDRATRRPLKPMPKPIYDGLALLQVKQGSENASKL